MQKYNVCKQNVLNRDFSCTAFIENKNTTSSFALEIFIKEKLMSQQKYVLGFFFVHVKSIQSFFIFEIMFTLHSNVCMNHKLFQQILQYNFFGKQVEFLWQTDTLYTLNYDNALECHAILFIQTTFVIFFAVIRLQSLHTADSLHFGLQRYMFKDNRCGVVQAVLNKYNHSNLYYTKVEYKYILG